MSIELRRPLAEVFAFLASPADAARLAPPELHLQLLEAPERLALGATLRWKARRAGVSQQMVHEVTAFDEDALIVVEQRTGPFGRWVFTHHFDAVEGGTRLREELDYEPPGGMLGRLLSAATLQSDVEQMFAFRAQKLRERFA
jgi:ligand-binding SRPBCC domain-containing protein